MTRRDVDEFLARTDALLAEPAPPLTACAWCSHPIDESSPSGEFCQERCAADWRAGLDRDPDERCRCITCDPEGAHHVRGRAQLGAIADALWRDPDRPDADEVLRRWQELRRQSRVNRAAELRDDSHDLPPAPAPPWIRPWIGTQVFAWDGREDSEWQSIGHLDETDGARRYYLNGPWPY